MRKILAILTVILLYACDNTPHDVISKGKMEDILFDYHLTQSMIYNLDRDEQESKAQEYIDAVFRKHGVTQEEFDASLIWYNRHADAYSDIYVNIKERLEDLNNDLQLQNGNKDMMAVFSTGGDTTNIWGAQKLLVLRNNNFQNKESFSIKADTSFHKGDSFILMCKTSLLLENRNDRREYLSVGLSVIYKDGRTIGRSRQISSNEKIQLTVETNDSSEIAKVSGFFYYNGSKDYRSLAFVDDIQLIRMHEQFVEESELKTDTIIEEPEVLPEPLIVSDSIHERISPEDLLQKNNQRERKIDIKAAPEIRTPNSFGKRKAAKARSAK